MTHPLNSVRYTDVVVRLSATLRLLNEYLELKIKEMKGGAPHSGGGHRWSDDEAQEIYECLSWASWEIETGLSARMDEPIFDEMHSRCNKATRIMKERSLVPLYGWDRKKAIAEGKTEGEISRG